MRMKIFAALGATALTLAACAPMPPAGTSGPVTTVPAVPTTLDANSRMVARNAINSEMQKRLPGVNVAPYTDCVASNATTAELIDIAQASGAGGSTADSVAAIVSRPATTQCIAGVAQAA
jgi:hypothetical protein